MLIKTTKKVVVCLEIGIDDARNVVSDISELLEHTKNLPGVVRAEAAPFVIENQERLGEFAKHLYRAIQEEEP